MASKKTPSSKTPKATVASDQPAAEAISKELKSEKSKRSLTVTKPRRVKDAKYQSFRLQRRIKPAQTLPGAFRLFGRTLGLLKRNWRVFSILIIVFGVVDFVAVQGFSAGQDLSSAKDTIKSVFGGGSADVASGIALFLYMVGSSASSTTTSVGPYQFIWVLISSLAFIWALRQTYAGIKFRARDAYYRGMYPLVTFLVVLLNVALALAPAILGGIIYNVASGGVASTGVERLMWAIVFGLLILLTLYLLMSCIFALYIVCLPDMTPMKALRASRQLAANRRWAVLRKIAFLPLALVVLGGAIMVPVILLIPAAASWVFFILTLFTLPILHGYYYSLYRSLL